jgi:hypothetical protein
MSSNQYCQVRGNHGAKIFGSKRKGLGRGGKRVGRNLKWKCGKNPRSPEGLENNNKGKRERGRARIPYPNASFRGGERGKGSTVEGLEKESERYIKK